MCRDRDRFSVRVFGSTEQPRKMQRVFHQIARATSRIKAMVARSGMSSNLGAVFGNVITPSVMGQVSPFGRCFCATRCGLGQAGNTVLNNRPNRQRRVSREKPIVHSLKVVFARVAKHLHIQSKAAGEAIEDFSIEYCAFFVRAAG